MSVIITFSNVYPNNLLKTFIVKHIKNMNLYGFKSVHQVFFCRVNTYYYIKINICLLDFAVTQFTICDKNIYHSINNIFMYMNKQIKIYFSNVLESNCQDTSGNLIRESSTKIILEKADLSYENVMLLKMSINEALIHIQYTDKKYFFFTTNSKNLLCMSKRKENTYKIINIEIFNI